VFQTYLSEAEPHENIWISETGNLAIQTGENGIIATGPTALALNTPYYIWFYFTRTTTANGSGWIKVGTTGTIPGTNELSWTNARVPNLGLAFAGFTTYHGAGYDFLVDQFILADQAIGSVADAPISTITLSVR
jgi:hypothetical protein